MSSIPTDSGSSSSSSGTNGAPAQARHFSDRPAKIPRRRLQREDSKEAKTCIDGVRGRLHLQTNDERVEAYRARVILEAQIALAEIREQGIREQGMQAMEEEADMTNGCRDQLLRESREQERGVGAQINAYIVKKPRLDRAAREILRAETEALKAGKPRTSSELRYELEYLLRDEYLMVSRAARLEAWRQGQSAERVKPACDRPLTLSDSPVLNQVQGCEEKKVIPVDAPDDGGDDADGEGDGDGECDAPRPDLHLCEHCDAGHPTDARALRCVEGCMPCCIGRGCRCMCVCRKAKKSGLPKLTVPKAVVRVYQVRGTAEKRTGFTVIRQGSPAFNIERKLYRFFMEVYGRVPTFHELSKYWPSRDITDAHGTVIALFEMGQTFSCMPCCKGGVNAVSMRASHLRSHLGGNRHRRKLEEAKAAGEVYYDGHTIHGTPGVYYGPEYPADDDEGYSSEAEREGEPAPELDDEELHERARENYGREWFDSLPLSVQEDGVMTVKYGECHFGGHALLNDWSPELKCGNCKPCHCDHALEVAHCRNACWDGDWVSRDEE